MSKTKEEWKAILSNLANAITDYGADYKYIENDLVDGYDENDENNENLLCPLAIRLFIPGSDFYLGKEYGETLYLNITGDALVYEYDWTFTEVDSPEWIFLGYADKLRHQVSKMQDKIKLLETRAEENKNWTGLIDTLGNKIYFGNIVHWTDGGDELSLEERIKTRWDRIAVVEKLLVRGIERPEIVFRVIDSPSERTKQYGDTFNYGSFIYKDTENYLTVVAGDKNEYKERFSNAGQCMEYVLKMREGNTCTIG